MKLTAKALQDFRAKIKNLSSEAKTQFVLEKLKQEKVIINFIKSADLRSLDKKGSDFVIIMIKRDHRIFIHLDVKSSLRSVLEYWKFKRRREICGEKTLSKSYPLLVLPNETVSSVRRRIEGIISICLR